MSARPDYIRHLNSQIDRVLKVVRPENGGPRKRTVLEGLVGEDVVVQMIERGQLVMHGKKRGATYGLPKGRK